MREWCEGLWLPAVKSLLAILVLFLSASVATPADAHEVPPAVLVTLNGGCDMTVPAYIYDDAGIVVQPSGTRLWVINEAIWIDGQLRWCDGDRWLRVSQCEGNNGFLGWREDKNNGSNHIGAFQISWVHASAIPGGFPAGVAHWRGNIAFAAELREASISPGDPDGLSDWRPWSGHCFDR